MVGSMNRAAELDDSVKFCEFESSHQPRWESKNLISIQETPSQSYLTTGDFWSRNIEMAELFRSGLVALEKTTHLKLQKVQLVPRRLD